MTRGLIATSSAWEFRIEPEEEAHILAGEGWEPISLILNVGWWILLRRRGWLDAGKEVQVD